MAKVEAAIVLKHCSSREKKSAGGGKPSPFCRRGLTNKGKTSRSLCYIYGLLFVDEQHLYIYPYKHPYIQTVWQRKSKCSFQHSWQTTKMPRDILWKTPDLHIMPTKYGFIATHLNSLFTHCFHITPNILLKTSICCMQGIKLESKKQMAIEISWNIKRNIIILHHKFCRKC